MELGISRVLMATDAVQIQQARAAEGPNLSLSCGLIKEIKKTVRLNFNYFECVHEPRICNKLAHAVAALSWECLEGDDPVLSSLPLCIQKLVTDDISAD